MAETDTTITDLTPDEELQTEDKTTTPGPLGSGPPTATSTQESYLANTLEAGTQVEHFPSEFTDRETQTANLYTFTPGLCLELIRDRHLSVAQMRNELALVLDEKSLNERNTERKLQNALEKRIAPEVEFYNKDLTRKTSELISIFTRHEQEAAAQMEQLKKSIQHATTLITEVQQTTHTDTGNEENTGTFLGLAYLTFPDTPFELFTPDLLDADTDYDRTFSNRKVAYYGDVPYKYAGGSHSPRDISTNPYLKQIVEHFKTLAPDQTHHYNSFMVTKYDKHTSSIPPHSDNEDSIDPESLIMTISLGASRPIIFRRKLAFGYGKGELTPHHGSLYAMSRASQDMFDHSVPPIPESDFTGPRISITCRVLLDHSARSTRPPRKPASTASRPKKVLILSDSKNASFDCSLFREPVIAFRENLFFLRDLHEHSKSIEKADVVLISAGINDMMKVSAADPITLHNHLKHFVQKYKTQFIFDCITNLSMSADPYNNMNRRINYLNELLLKLSLRTPNFKLFENICFGLPHLSRDGLHLNHAGKSAMTDCWVHCILITLGFRQGPLPLRRQYISIIEEFYCK